MRSARVFCSACDRPVSVMLSVAPRTDGQATLHDDEVVCLEIGDRCTGELCPIGAVAPHAMVARLVRLGLPTDALRTVNATCPTCEVQVEMVLYGGGKAACTVCGAAAHWVAGHAEPLP
ncbi:MAG: hypothetical protein OEW77_02660 [Gemmatimonadota bacterium]|nr:hypothetical protein [Gemmatimonadota bacterium]